MLGVVVALILIGGGWYAYKAAQPTEVLAPTPEAGGSDFTGSGFVQQIPSSLPGDSMATASPSTSPSSSPKTSAVTITISDTEFSPATVTVKAGTTVTFVNNGQGLHRPASDPHPTHTDLPGFDSKRGLSTGESYSFVFDKVGTWGFHDHLNTSMTGSVVVQ